MDHQELADRLQQLIDSGTEAEARDFLIEHFKELPEETQKSLAVELFSEALRERLSELEAFAQLKSDMAEAIEAIREP